MPHAGRPPAQPETPEATRVKHGHAGQPWDTQVTEKKLQWALTHIFLNTLRTSPRIAELSWSISGRRRKRI